MFDRDHIQNILSRFFNAFDAKNWEALSSMLNDTVKCDYSDLRGVVELISANEYVQRRIDALTPLKTQHIIANLEIYPTGEMINCYFSMLIYRKRENNFFNTHATYHMSLVENNNELKISYIKQTVLWNDGDPSLHSGISNVSD